MSETVSQRAEQGDAELITAVRVGDNAAYGVLFERHRFAALRLGRQLLPGAESEDLVSEAFTKVLVQLQEGRGPDLAFRAYLLTSIRRLHVDRIRSAARVRTTDDEAELDRHVEFFDVAAADFERGTAADAFASLPERWQLVLWHLDVEGQKPADVAPILGMSANSVSALAYRAREGLRQAYLQHHLADTASGNCRWTTERLGAHVRKGLSNRDAARVDGHLDDCRRCMGIHLELTEVNSNLSGILAPALLGTAAAGYLAAGSAGAAATTGAAVGFKALVSAVFEPAKAAVAGAGVQGAAAVVVVAAVAATGIYAAAGGLGQDDSAAVKSPAAVATTVPAPTTGSTTPPIEERTEESSGQPLVAPTPAFVIPPAVSTPGTLDGVIPSDPPVDSPVDPPDEPPVDPPAFGPTDLGVTAVVGHRGLLRPTVTIPVTSETKGTARDPLTLTLTIDFNGINLLPGVISPDPDWKCGRGPARDTLICTRIQSGTDVPPFAFTATPLLRSGGTVTVSAADNKDPNPGNNTAKFVLDLLPQAA